MKIKTHFSYNGYPVGSITSDTTKCPKKQIDKVAQQLEKIENYILSTEALLFLYYTGQYYKEYQKKYSVCKQNAHFIVEQEIAKLRGLV